MPLGCRLTDGCLKLVHLPFGDVVQLEEQRTVNPYVASSSLAISATQGYSQTVKATPFDGVSRCSNHFAPAKCYGSTIGSATDL